jgi:hypothetical protein
MASAVGGDGLACGNMGLCRGLFGKPLGAPGRSCPTALPRPPLVRGCGAGGFGRESLLAWLGRRASLVIAVRGATPRNSTRTTGELDGHQFNFLRRVATQKLY